VHALLLAQMACTRREMCEYIYIIYRATIFLGGIICYNSIADTVKTGGYNKIVGKK